MKFTFEGINSNELDFKSEALNEGPLGYIVDNTYLKKLFSKKYWNQTL